MKHQKFLERFAFHAVGGKGGAGNKKFGAVGGRGGHVYLKAADNYSLTDTRNRMRVLVKKPTGANGTAATASNLITRSGEDTIVKVPTNSVVYDSMWTRLGYFQKEDDTLLIARGGAGGSQLNDFLGQRGMIERINVVLKILADVGFVGFPNAGKSTLLTSLSKATPMIAPYAFTTMQPQIGHLHYNDHRKLSMADLPGLIEGAWNNEGLGHEFLQHVERTKLLLYVIDVNGFQLSNDGPHRSAFECIMLLNKELEIYDNALLFKPSILTINKMDSKGSQAKFDKLIEQLKNRTEIYNSYPDTERPKILVKFTHVVPVAAKFRQNIEDLKDVIRDSIDDMYKDVEKNKVKSVRKKLCKLLQITEKRLYNF